MNSSNDTLFEQGIELFNQGFYLKNRQDIQKIVDSFKIFVKLNKQLDDYSLLKPKTLCYIALCNFKIGNLKESYQIALNAKKLIPIVIKNSPFEGLIGEMIGLNKIEELLGTIETKYFDSISGTDFINNLDENYINLEKVEQFLNA